MIKKANCANCGKNLKTETYGKYKKHKCGLPKLYKIKE